MGAFDNIVYGKVVSVERDGTFYHKYHECTMYNFKLEIVRPIGDTIIGKFYHRYTDSVDKLGFEVGESMMFEVNKYKDQLNPVI